MNEKMYVPENVVVDFFEKLNEENIIYVVRNNIDGELPRHLKATKDIDLLIYEKCIDRFEHLMRNMGFQKNMMYDQRQFLEGTRGNIMWKNDFSLLQVHIFYDLCCKGLSMEWNKIGEDIQNRIWSKKKWDNVNCFWVMDNETQFIYLIARSIFDKNSFQRGYIKEINHLCSNIDKSIVKGYLTEIFGDFTDELIGMIERQNYDQIIKTYFSFKDSRKENKQVEEFLCMFDGLPQKDKHNVAQSFIKACDKIGKYVYE